MFRDTRGRTPGPGQRESRRPGEQADGQRPARRKPVAELDVEGVLEALQRIGRLRRRRHAGRRCHRWPGDAPVTEEIATDQKGRETGSARMPGWRRALSSIREPNSDLPAP